MKRDYKKLAKGVKKFKTAFPNGKVVKAKASESKKFKIEEAEEVGMLFTKILSKEGAKRYLPLLKKYPEAVAPPLMKFAKQIFMALERDEIPVSLDNPNALRHIPGLSHPKIVDGYWAGEDYELLEFLAENTSRTTKQLQATLEAEGFSYSVRQIQNVRKKYR